MAELYLVGGNIVCATCGVIRHFKFSGAIDPRADLAERLADRHTRLLGDAHRTQVQDVYSDKPLKG